MAKKVRNRPEAAEEHKFEFPVFDEKTFIRHELELTTGSVLAIGWSVLAAGVSAVVSLSGSLGSSGPTADLNLALAIFLGVVLVIVSALLFPRIDRGFASYTRGEWASIFLLEIFGWLGFWLLMAGAFGHLAA
jgi:hypothetical protein